MLEQWVTATILVFSDKRAFKSSMLSSAVSGLICHSLIIIPCSASLRHAPTFASWSWFVTMTSSPGLRRLLIALERTYIFIVVEPPIIISSVFALIISAKSLVAWSILSPAMADVSNSA